MDTIQLVVHGRGNAWPVPLGESHPFYDRTDPRDLSNAAFSLVTGSGNKLSEILIDAGHGTIQSLVSGSNRIPDCICLTHGHMDHTLSVDWVVQSYWRQHDRKKRYPLYSTMPTYRFLIQSYPHLEELIDFRELIPGIPQMVGRNEAFRLTAYPVYHGNSAAGASMLLFEKNGYRILFTGDLFSPLLREEDYHQLGEIHMMVVDTNNRFPWPRTNHWSFAGDREIPVKRNDTLETFMEKLEWETVCGPHELQEAGDQSRAYFNQLKEEWSTDKQALTIMEFLKRIRSERVMLVHYSGMEDQKYYGQESLPSGELLSWVSSTAALAGIDSKFIIPESGQIIEF